MEKTNLDIPFDEIMELSDGDLRDYVKSIPNSERAAWIRGILKDEGINYAKFARSMSLDRRIFTSNFISADKAALALWKLAELKQYGKISEFIYETNRFSSDRRLVSAEQLEELRKAISSLDISLYGFAKLYGLTGSFLGRAAIKGQAGMTRGYFDKVMNAINDYKGKQGKLPTEKETKMAIEQAPTTMRGNTIALLDAKSESNMPLILSELESMKNELRILDESIVEIDREAANIRNQINDAKGKAEPVNIFGNSTDRIIEDQRKTMQDILDLQKSEKIALAPLTALQEKRKHLLDRIAKFERRRQKAERQEMLAAATMLSDRMALMQDTIAKMETELGMIKEWLAKTE